MAGIERVTLLCAQGLRRRYPDVRCIVHMFGNYKVPEQMQSNDIIFHPDCHPFFCGRKLSKWIHSGQVWVVCQPMATLSLVLWNPQLTKRLPIVTVLHGALHVEMDGQRKTAQYKLFAAISRRRRYKIAAVSESLARYAEMKLHLPERSVVTLYNPAIDLDRMSQVDSDCYGKEHGTSFTCVAVGRLAPQKGFDLLIEAFHSANVEASAQLRIYGEGGERSKLQTLIDSGPRASQIKLMGYREDAQRAVSASDLFIMSSRYEGLSGAMLEAIAYRRRIISTDHPFGAREALDNGRFGALVQQPYVVGLASEISREYELWKAKAIPSVEVAQVMSHLAPFTIEVACSRYFELLQSFYCPESRHNPPDPARLHKAVNNER